MRVDLEKIKKVILVDGLVDWVSIISPLFAARQILGGAGEREALPLAIQAVKELLREGLILVGETSRRGFEPWTGSLASIEQRLDWEAKNIEFPVRFGDICWIDNTERGEQMANHVMKTEPDILDDQ
ncbi:hypothetical protein [Saccharomonospora piscinae]|uniref:hypothetical protein n=1 Tax=Saccharomonospora piscinae TaxID=687388 RepID=UPI0012DC8D8A|nr:hypothetical protein [Saccharomonospora piscinae]